MCTRPDPEKPTYNAEAVFAKNNLPEGKTFYFKVIATDCEHGNVIVRLPNNNIWVETE